MFNDADNGTTRSQPAIFRLHQTATNYGVHSTALIMASTSVAPAQLWLVLQGEQCDHDLIRQDADAPMEEATTCRYIYLLMNQR
ncbi:predicted protein [Uncinocarpus reesii 1704]|uniref:Uncharacterized protein n=1 Tax=Uncinocarpus reesii (strain UAMH 1704) TaxID=336963 RepID=C4JVX1_UNCRE|nr:uncharacterized protein UREG_06713 [Uncinocarpus reesii 1704]EEP81848.1 predicted protein [Uncinocarpus reesii 1704]